MIRILARVRVVFVTIVLLGSSINAAEIWEFTGESCGACRQMASTIDQIRSMGVPVRQIDVQRESDLARSLDVQYIPCFIAVVDGKPFDRISGVATAQQLVDLYQRARTAVSPQAIVRGQSEPPRAPWAQLSNSQAKEVPVSPAVLTPATPTPSALTPASAATSVASTAEQRALAATVRIKVIDAKGHSYGTGTVVHTMGQEALVLTCGHIFRDSAGKGQIVCDLLVDQLPREVPARLVSFDLRRDVGLISLQPGGTVYPARVGGTGARQRPGDQVFAIGCSHGSSPTVNRNVIRAVNRYHGPANLVVGGRPVDGRSGGGLFDSEGTLIGVCNAADQQEDEGVYAALGPIHAELDESGLSFIYRNQPSQPATVPVSTAVAAVAPSAASSLPSQIPQSDSSREVIVILRQRGAASQDGQAYVLDRPSDSLLQVLSSELAQRGAHVSTQFEGTTGPSSWSPLPQR